MPRLMALLFLVCGLSLAGSPAAALPAPMSAEELVAVSDVVARVRVVAVTCVAVSTSERTGEKLPSYKAELEIREISKGKFAPSDTIEVRFSEIESGLLGPWTVFYYPGEEVWTHLQRDDGGSAYQTTWWNARGETLHAADTTELPTEIGATVHAR